MTKLTLQALKNTHNAWRGFIRNLGQAEAALNKRIKIEIAHMPVDPEIEVQAELVWGLAAVLTTRARYYHSLAKARVEIPKHELARLHVMENSIEDRILHSAP